MVRTWIPAIALLFAVASCSQSPDAPAPKAPQLPEDELAVLRARITENLERAQTLCKEHGISGEQVSAAFYAADWKGAGEARLAGMPAPIKETMLALYRDLRRHNELVTKAQDEADGLAPTEATP